METFVLNFRVMTPLVFEYLQQHVSTLQSRELPQTLKKKAFWPSFTDEHDRPILKKKKRKKGKAQQDFFFSAGLLLDCYSY